MKTTTLTLSDNCPKCRTKTLELDPEGDVHCWGCGTTHGKPEKRDYLLERHQFYEKNKAAILKDVQSVGTKATARKWKVPGASLYHVLQRWEREAKLSEPKEKREVNMSKQSNIPKRHQYYEKNKDAIINDLLIIGRVATRKKWGIPNGSSLHTLERRWLTREQKVEVDRASGSQVHITPKITQEDINRVFGVGQSVLVRAGTKWNTREIIGITISRNNAHCPHCGGPLLGAPRFWFQDHGNVPLEEVIAREDIDPGIIPNRSADYSAP